MADEITSPSAEGNAGDGAGQDAGASSQEQHQGQEAGQTQVEGSGQTSSAGQSGRKGNGAWATERIIEKALKRQSQEFQSAMSALVDRLTPQAPKETPIAGQEEPDYNNLSGWLNKKVESLLQERLSKELPNHLSQFESKLKGVSKTQEARNYLLSQEDIGSNEDKLAEIGDIMKRERLDYIAVNDPLWAIQKAIKIYRDSHKNPNAPTKGQLSTVSGGAGTQFKKEASVEQLRALQAKLAAGLPQSELEKVNAEIDALMAVS